MFIITSCNPGDKKSETGVFKVLEPTDPTSFDKEKNNQNSNITKQLLNESFQEEDEIVNEYLKDELGSIRENFKQFNSKSNWTTIDSIPLWETTEGGHAAFFYEKEFIRKIVERRFGETFQSLTEYYILNKELSFVYEKSIKYNRPIYWDSTIMNENEDTEVFNIDSSKIQEERSYFKQGKLLHKIESGDCGSPFAEEYLIEEQKRLLEQYKTLLQKAHKHNNGYK